MARTYNSPAREAAAKQTRDALVRAALDVLLEDGGDAELSHKEVAARAGVSVRTAYNHFPTREELLDVVDEAIGEQMGRAPMNWDDPMAALHELYEFFERNEELLRAASARRSQRSLRDRRRVRGRKHLEDWAKAQLPDADRDARQAVVALAHLFLSSPTFLDLRRAGLTRDAAAALAERSLKSELARQRRAVRARKKRR